MGIGASAGGLEALEQFFSGVPLESGLAFVIVQHLDPTRKGMLVELLQHATPMPVAQIEDRMTVKPDHVYVIPPDHDLSVLHGRLHPLEPSAPRGLRLPIDSFLRSLADDQGERSLGVILSGMGSDGTLGLRAIKARGGGGFVQDPASAKFDSMPRSAIDAGSADCVARPVALAGQIIAYLRAPSRAPSGAVVVPSRGGEESGHSGLEKVVLLLRAQTGHDFSLYKKSTIYRRIERRMGLHQLVRIADYARYLRENPPEATLLFKELLIGVTSFFRDPAVWEQLRTEVLPAWFAARPAGGTMRAWVAGCSTGEEAYTLAMTFRDALADVKPAVPFNLQVFATDLDEEAIDRARTGKFRPQVSADVSMARLRDYFVEESDGGFTVSKTIREMVIFAPQNLVMDPPFTKLDLLSCRNLLIYLEADLQRKLLPLFHYSLHPDGVLLLGSSETVGQSHDLFIAMPGKNRLYRRQDQQARPAEPVEFPSAFARARGTVSDSPRSSAAAPATQNLQVLTEALLLEHHAPAAVLTTRQGDILYISGKIGAYLEPAAGKANLNIFAMARDEIAAGLHEAFSTAVRKNTEVVLKDVKSGGGRKGDGVSITVRALGEAGSGPGQVLVVFKPAERRGREARAPSPTSPGGTRLSQLEDELRRCREDLQTTREEMQSSQEELRSSNEELQSTNEELQSTNEELTTSKEEMQSMNEELQTMNHELQSKVDELGRASDDMKNLLNSTDIATLFLDGDLKVRRFTKQTAKIIKLIDADAGRPITDLVSDLDYDELPDDVATVLQSLVVSERQVTARNGRSFAVRIMPYRAQDNRVDGVVITFTDMTQSKQLENRLLETQAMLEKRLAARAEPSAAKPSADPAPPRKGGRRSPK